MTCLQQGAKTLGMAKRGKRSLTFQGKNRADKKSSRTVQRHILLSELGTIRNGTLYVPKKLLAKLLEYIIV